MSDLDSLNLILEFPEGKRVFDARQWNTSKSPDFSYSHLHLLTTCATFLSLLFQLLAMYIQAHRHKHSLYVDKDIQKKNQWIRWNRSRARKSDSDKDEDNRYKRRIDKVWINSSCWCWWETWSSCLFVYLHFLPRYKKLSLSWCDFFSFLRLYRWCREIVANLFIFVS